MRLLLVGHMSHTGFGTVTRRLGEEFLGRGIDVRIIAVNHRGDPIQGPLASRVWPAALRRDGFGADIIPGAIDGTLWTSFGHELWKPDAMLVVSDFTGFTSHIGLRLHPAWLTIPVFHYMPVEGDNFPLEWGEIWNHPAAHQSVPKAVQEAFADLSFHPVAMSHYGSKVIGDLTGRDVPVIYHGVDTDVFRPVSAADPLLFEGKFLRTKEQCRAAFGIDPAAKVILRTDRNVVRKFYYRFAEVVTLVHAQVPDLRAIIHCAPIDEGLNLYQEISRQPKETWPVFGLTNAHDTWTGLPIEGMVALYNAADLYVSTTGGEGFGLNLAESMACGVPVVVTDWAADAETVGPGGVLIPPLTDSYGDPVRYHSSYGMDWAMPDARAFVAPIVDLLNKPHRRKAMGDAGKLHVRRSFNWGTAADQFVTLFDSVLSSEAAA